MLRYKRQMGQHPKIDILILRLMVPLYSFYNMIFNITRRFDHTP